MPDVRTDDRVEADVGMPTGLLLLLLLELLDDKGNDDDIDIDDGFGDREFDDVLRG